MKAHHVPSVLLALLLAGTVFYTLQLKDRVQQLETNLSTAETALADARKQAGQAAQASSEASKRIEEQALEYQSRLAEADKSSDAEANSEVNPQAEIKRAERQRKMMENFSEMMENPIMNEMVVAQQKAQLEVLYKNLMEEFNFSPEEESYFMDLMMQRQMQHVDLGMKMMSGQLDAEAMEGMVEEMEATHLSMRDQMKDFLNHEEDFTRFEHYEDTLQERMALAGFFDQMARSNENFTRDSEEAIIDIMLEEREAFEFSNDYSQDNFDWKPEIFKTESIDTQIAEMRTVNERIEKRVSELLTPEQLESFSRSQAQMLSMQEASLKMAAGMMGQE